MAASTCRGTLPSVPVKAASLPPVALFLASAVMALWLYLPSVNRPLEGRPARIEFRPGRIAGWQGFETARQCGRNHNKTRGLHRIVLPTRGRNPCPDDVF